MVLRICRSALHDPENTEDAYQATFLVLAHRAGSIRRRDSVASWLFGVSHEGREGPTAIEHRFCNWV